MIEAGEVLVRRRLRRASDGLPVPLQVQVLEADLLDASQSGVSGSRHMVQGIEFDGLGRRRAYWLHAAHPGDSHGFGYGDRGSHAVPASEISHVYEKQRTQVRGVPWGAPVIRSLRDLDDYEVAEIVRKKTEACVTAIVFGDEEAQQGIAPSVVDADGNRVEQFEPGLIAYARGGKDIRSRQGFYLAIPTAAAGRADGGRKITPLAWERRTGELLRFVYRRNGPSLLVADAMRARGGKRCGFAVAGAAARRTGRGLVTVPIFILVPQVTVRKRLDVAAVVAKWERRLPGLVARRWE